MFSSSLLTMIVHTLPPEARAVFAAPPDGSPGRGAPTTLSKNEMVARFARVLGNSLPGWPLVPVVARAHPEVFEKLLQAMPFDVPRDHRHGFLWGRIPLDYLIARFLSDGSAEADHEHLDLGTPITAAAKSAAGTHCTNLLARTPQSKHAAIGAAIVDLGQPGSSGSPETYGGKLRHVPYSMPVDLDAHAEDVLAVLLGRLEATPTPNGAQTMLDVTTISMALVCAPAASQVNTQGDCFKQHCAPELLTALQKVTQLLDADNLPAVVNVSLGTHVGPHNGHSPLEQYIAKSVFNPSDRFLFAAAGNEGGMGISSRLELTTNETDFMELLVDKTCQELLVEFWWDDAVSATGAGVEIATKTIGSGITPLSLKIRSGTPAQFAAGSPAATRTNTDFFTLLEAPAQGSMACIAFAISRTPSPGGTLSQLQVGFDITATSADTVIQAWVVLGQGTGDTRFTQGGPQGTINVPASDPTVVSVAGRDGKQMWRNSSRGPASHYLRHPIKSPKMAHLVDAPSPANSKQAGTSYASPRAAADATQVLADPGKRANAVDAEALVQETYAGHVRPWTWSERYGYHHQDS